MNNKNKALIMIQHFFFKQEKDEHRMGAQNGANE